ncbi:hypothetical protein D9757_013981 [Collybiopsis confluens]|uniref:Carboxylic ester hydrolase n=1 Tax=Collybiopsis confluens TaxID=2823264 RepID=A0A8H5CQ66_9AGAR|nr:hypothetical protein D9757_013981 [Collybiopsis confluens]
MTKKFPAAGLLLCSLLSIAATSTLAIPQSRQSGAPTIDLGYAQYQGVFDEVNNLTSYFGIRYAAPPTGNLRWRAPQAPANNDSTVQQANTQPAPCFQAPTGAGATNPLQRRAGAPGTPSEDCLFLNVFFPGDTVPTKPLPTLFWIHGGGYIMGGASTNPGGDLVRESHNEIVVVVIQYRLGLFGFLAGSEVKANGDLNAGLLDQDFALRWAQQHIPKFGGDPTKVTIWGESAGAGSVLQHVVAQDGKTNPPLFRGAITSSTFLPSQYFYNDTVPESLYSEVVSQTNCTSSSDTLSCLRSVNATTLGTLNNNINLDGFFGTFLFVPVVDGTFITQRPTLSLKQGKVNGNALLAVTNTNEGVNFVNQRTPISNVTLYASTLFLGFGPEQADQTAALYENLGTAVVQEDLIMGESIFICPTYYLLSAFPTSFKGEFAIPPGTHGEDVNFYFTSAGTPAFNNPDFLAAFQGGFLAFVVSQDPNDKIVPTLTPQWNLYSDGNTEVVFNKTAGGLPNLFLSTTDSGLLERCDFWDSVGEFAAQ